MLLLNSGLEIRFDVKYGNYDHCLIILRYQNSKSERIDIREFEVFENGFHSPERLYGQGIISGKRLLYSVNVMEKHRQKTYQRQLDSEVLF